MGKITVFGRALFRIAVLKKTAFKKSYDIMIIGGGIIGTSISYNLMHDGFDGSILVIEKDPIYQFASTTLSAGGVREQFSLPEIIKISQYSIGIFENFDDLGIKVFRDCKLFK